MKLPMPFKEAALALVALAVAAGPVLYVIGGIATGIAAIGPAFAIASGAIGPFCNGDLRYYHGWLCGHLKARRYRYRGFEHSPRYASRALHRRVLHRYHPGRGSGPSGVRDNSNPGGNRSVSRVRDSQCAGGDSGHGDICHGDDPGGNGFADCVRYPMHRLRRGWYQLMATAALPALLGTLAAVGVAAAVAAAALGDTISDLVRQIPLIGGLVEGLTGITAANKAAADAEKQYTEQVQKTADYLKAKGIVVDRGKLSLDDYTKALRAAARTGADMDDITIKATIAIENQKKAHAALVDQLKVTQKQLELIKKVYAAGNRNRGGPGSR